MTAKRVLVGPFGALFVPNVDEDTIQQKLASGEWREVPKAEPKPRPARGKK